MSASHSKTGIVGIMVAVAARSGTPDVKERLPADAGSGRGFSRCEKLWYGMPAYAKEGKVVCFFQSAKKFNSRYATLGFNEEANLDEGAMWATSFALKELTATEEGRRRRHTSAKSCGEKSRGNFE